MTIPVFSPVRFMPTAVGGGGWTGPTSGIVSQWWMDDSHVSGATVTDSGSNNNTGTSVTFGGGFAGVTSTSSPAGAFYSTARAFDNASWISLASNAQDWTSSFTLGMWVNLVNIAAAGGGDGSRASFFDFTNTGNSSYMRVLNETVVAQGAVGFSQSGAGLSTTGAVMANNTWLHAGYTFNSSGSVKALYINGSSVSTTGDSAGNFGSALNAVMGGGDGGTGGGLINGSMYNVVLYNRALSSGEMSTLFSAK